MVSPHETESFEKRNRLRGRILVIETGGMSQAVAPLLIPRFDTVETVGDGIEAIEAFLRGRPDLVVLNLGFMVGERVKTWDRTLALSIPERKLLLVLSDSRLTSDEQIALDSGADEYLRKPISARRLTWRVRAMLRRSAFGDEGV